jgi:hypothetical protein
MTSIAKIFAKFVLVSILGFCFQSIAGTDHDHGAPTFQPPKGGILRSTAYGHFELVKKDSTLNFYHYDDQGKTLPTAGIKLAGSLELPKKKTLPLSVSDKGTHWEAALGEQKAHRTTVKLKITKGTEVDDVKFTVENK